ncbi:MAG: hypothetical protein Q8J74_02710 [Candidatus Didemnitutus sp.]|nr:hypothetical protein [Candidatus Didemnitutus sp.]
MQKPTRRQFILGALGAAALAGLTAWVKRNSLIGWAVRRTSNDALNLTAAPRVTSDLCVLTAAQPEGPFFIPAPERSDLREDRVGKELELQLQLVHAPHCAPIEGAVVEIWQCDAEGVYSGYPEDIAHDLWRTFRLVGRDAQPVPPVNEKRFLRGAQVSDAQGKVSFSTIFPGWHEPRAPHLHFKIFTADRVELTSQFYFDPAFCDLIYRTYEPYTRHGPCPFTPQNDVVLHDYQHATGLLLRPAWNDDGPLEISAKIGLPRPR